MTTIIADVRLLPKIPLRASKAKQQGAWSSGDYAVIGTTLRPHAQRQILNIAGGTVMTSPIGELSLAQGNGGSPAVNIAVGHR